MRFGPTAEQLDFREALDALLAGADTGVVARAWAAGEHTAGLGLWQQLAELGVTGLRTPEDLGGLGASVADTVIAFEQLGHHAVPGPWIDSVVLAPVLLAGTDHEPVLERIAAGDALTSFVVDPTTRLGLDADVATHRFRVADGVLTTASVGARIESVDPVRRLFELTGDSPGITLDPARVDRAVDESALACAAALLGAGERLLSTSVEYVGARKQFGRVIGEYQSVKHLLADIRVRLDFARPLVWGAALDLDADSPSASRAVSAAKVACADAAHLAARVGLQTHGAIGYTLEYDLSLWLLRVRANLTAWGTPSWHRQRILDSLGA